MTIRQAEQRIVTTIGVALVWSLFLYALDRYETKHQAESNPSPASAAQRFGRRVDKILGGAPANKGAWGLLIVDAETGERLYEHNSDKYFLPASNMKLFTTALTLATLGADYRFHTTLESTGTITREGRLTASLSLVGRGDPNLSNRKFPFELKEEFEGPAEKVLADLADQLVAKGVKVIAGDIIGDDSYFQRERYPSGWEVDDIVWEYGAAVSALVVNDNTVTLTLRPGRVAGEAVQATITPSTQDFTVRNMVVTAPARAKAQLTLTREPGAHLVVVKGALPKKSPPRKLILAIEEPALHAAMMMKELLEARGVQVEGVATARNETVTSDSHGSIQQIFAEHLSVPLRDAVKVVNKLSQNLHAEVLLRAAMRETAPGKYPGELVKFTTDFYTKAGIAPDDVIQTDGSGLSRHDLVTPVAVVTLLRYAQTQPWFGPFYLSLPVAGVDGTLEDTLKDTVAVGRVHAKTGSFEHVRTLSGFAETPAGRRLIFSFLSNNQQGKNRESTDAVEELCVAMIEEFNALLPERTRFLICDARDSTGESHD
jgi:serine-type D-Ala-D-Ala carboxypeptidase/endopeptidase (penicillin-binding protein 4)